MGNSFSNVLNQYLVSVAWVLNVKPNRTIDSQNGCILEMELYLGWVKSITGVPDFEIFLGHQRESVLQWLMVLRQIFFVYQRTTHTAWRERDAMGRRFLDPWRLKETHFRLDSLAEKMFCGGVCTQIVVLRDKQIPTTLLSQKQKISFFCLYQFKVGRS